MDYGIFLNGEFVSVKQSEAVKSPYDGHTVGMCGRAGPEDFEAAIEASVRAAPMMRALPAGKRAQILLNTRDLIHERADRFARTMVEEAGKPIRYAEGEVARCQDTLTDAAETARRMEGEVLSMDAFGPGEGKIGLLKRVPVGPVSAITPFNFPLNLVTHKIAPAVAAGCPVVVKPASQTPFSALLLAEAFRDAGLPPGALAVLPANSRIAAPLVEDDRMKALTFTGSAEVGWKLKARAGKKRVALELGGNAAAIVEPDADLEAAARRLAGGAYAYAGQSCISVQRVLVHRDVYGRFREMFVTAVKESVPFGDPARRETVAGPLITSGDADRIQDWVKRAEGSGAKVLAGGGREGSVLEPLVLENVDHAAEISCHEAFGPVAVLDAYSDFDEALRTANDSVYGLQAGVFTADLAKAMRAWDALEVGGVVVNDFPTFRVDHMPYGGVKDSGLGREGPRFALEHLTELRLLVVNLTVPGS
jgi:acyl-CoA reductase-like NAD-dependent aldehyde dehydrogenase